VCCRHETPDQATGLNILRYLDLKIACGLGFSWAVPEIDWKVISLASWWAFRDNKSSGSITNHNREEPEVLNCRRLYLLL
jgi:hypothetical protein